MTQHSYQPPIEKNAYRVELSRNGTPAEPYQCGVFRLNLDSVVHMTSIWIQGLSEEGTYKVTSFALAEDSQLNPLSVEQYEELFDITWEQKNGKLSCSYQPLLTE